MESGSNSDVSEVKTQALKIFKIVAPNKATYQFPLKGLIFGQTILLKNL